MRCSAKSKRTGEQCKRSAAVGMDVCSMHGGRSLKGAASPRFKTGIHSKHLPVRMVSAYEAALNDPQLVDLDASIALIDARVIDLLGRVDSGESGAVWKSLSKAYDDLRKALRESDGIAQMDALMVLDGLIHQGAADYQAWAEVTRLLDDRRKHVETKQKVELSGERAVSVSELATFMGAMMALIQSTVSNPREKQQIADGMERILTPRGAQIQ